MRLLDSPVCGACSDQVDNNGMIDSSAKAIQDLDKRYGDLCPGHLRLCWVHGLDHNRLFPLNLLDSRHAAPAERELAACTPYAGASNRIPVALFQRVCCDCRLEACVARAACLPSAKAPDTLKQCSRYTAACASPQHCAWPVAHASSRGSGLPSVVISFGTAACTLEAAAPVLKAGDAPSVQAVDVCSMRKRLDQMGPVLQAGLVCTRCHVCLCRSLFRLSWTRWQGQRTAEGLGFKA